MMEIFQNTEFVHLGLVLGAFVAIFIFSELWRYFAQPPTEWTRKFVHLSCGIIIACFHWLFASVWSVIALFVIFGLLMGIARSLKLFPSIYGVKRSSLGDIYYLLSALVLFLVSQDRPVVYFISMLTLTVSDALAAVLGSTYQRTVYSVETHYKSLEGSVVFFLSTFLIVHIPLLLLLEIDPLQSIMIALQLALVVTCLEAICLNGFDNIMIPIGTYFLLVKLLPISSERIAWQVGWQLVIIAFLYYISVRFNFISISGAIVGQLFLCGAFVFGGPNWLIVPLIAFGIFVALFAALMHKNASIQEHKIYQVIAAFNVTIVPGLLFFAHNISEKYVRPHMWEKNNHFFYTLFIGAVVAHLIIALYRLLWLYTNRNHHISFPITVAIATGCFILLIPFGLWLQIGCLKASDLAVCALLIGFAVSCFYAAFNRFPIFKQFPWEFRIQSLSVLAGVIFAFPFHLMSQ
jgi:dolichol kinase